MARFDVEFTKTYEEYDGAYRPVDRTVENVEKTRRDGTLLVVVIAALAAIIIVFLVMAFVAAIMLKSPAKASMSPPCIESASPITASLLPEEAGISPTILVSTNDGSSMDSGLELCSAKTDSLSSTSTEEKTLPEPTGGSTEISVNALRKPVAVFTSTLKGKPQRGKSRSATPKKSGYMVSPSSVVKSSEGLWQYRWIVQGELPRFADYEHLFPIVESTRESVKTVIDENDPVRRLIRARAWMKKREGKEDGNGRGLQMIKTCRALFTMFGLTEEQVRPLILEFNERCVPPYTEKQLRHKVGDAQKGLT